MDRSKDVTSMLARRPRRTELLRQLVVARRLMSEAALALAPELLVHIDETEYARRELALAERRMTVAAVYEALAGLFHTQFVVAAAVDAATALRELAEETVAMHAAVEQSQAEVSAAMGRGAGL